MVHARLRMNSAEEEELGSGVKARRGKDSSGGFSVFLIALFFSFEKTQTPTRFSSKGSSLTYERHGLWSQEDLSLERCLVAFDELPSLSTVYLAVRELGITAVCGRVGGRPILHRRAIVCDGWLVIILALTELSWFFFPWLIFIKYMLSFIIEYDLKFLINISRV